MVLRSGADRPVVWMGQTQQMQLNQATKTADWRKRWSERRQRWEVVSQIELEELVVKRDESDEEKLSEDPCEVATVLIAWLQQCCVADAC